jgi:hypothetical protein
MSQVHVRTCLLIAVIAIIATPALADYTTEVKVYLDVGAGAANDTRFDFTSAINHPDDDPDDGTDDTGDGLCVHLRDFAFNCGFYDDNDGPGAGTDRFICSASNATGRSNSYPKNPGRDPIAISSTGWYTLKHTFRDDAGVLAVDLEVIDSGSTSLNTWTLSDPTDTIPDRVGGNRYAWFASNEFSFLAFDESQKCSGACSYVQGFEVDISGWDAFGGAYDATRVASGTNGVTSDAGSFHAEGGTSAGNWGGYGCTFPGSEPPAVPLESHFGLAVLALLLLVSIPIVVAGRRVLGRS